MDEEVKRRRKEREQLAAEKRLSEDRIRLLEEGHKHLLANLVSQKTMHNQSLVPLTQNQLLRQKLSQSALQQVHSGGGGVSQLQRIQSQSALQLQQQQKPKLPQNMMSVHSIQIQQRTPKSWPNTSTSAPSSSSRAALPSLSQFYPQSFLSGFSQLKSSALPLQSSAPSPALSSTNPLDEILDLTVSSPSPSPDAGEAGLNHGGLTRQSAAAAFDELESLFSEISQVPSVALPPPPSLPAAHPPAHSMLASNHQDLMEYFDVSLSPQMSTQKASPSSSTSSGSASSFSNSLAPPVPSGLLSVSSLMPAAASSSSSSPSSLFSSPSSSSSLFSSASPHFPSTYSLLAPSDSLQLPNGHCSATALDVREALNSMLQAGADRKSVIQYRHQD